jgi:hypothetical protein
VQEITPDRAVYHTARRGCQSEVPLPALSGPYLIALNPGVMVPLCLMFVVAKGSELGRTPISKACLMNNDQASLHNDKDVASVQRYCLKNLEFVYVAQAASRIRLFLSCPRRMIRLLCRTSMRVGHKKARLSTDLRKRRRRHEGGTIKCRS